LSSAAADWICIVLVLGAEEIKRALEITKYAPADQGLFLSSVALLRLAKAYQLGYKLSEGKRDVSCE